MVTGPVFRMALKEPHYKNNFNSFVRILAVSGIKNTYLRNTAYIYINIFYRRRT